MSPLNLLDPIHFFPQILQVHSLQLSSTPPYPILTLRLFHFAPPKLEI